MVVKRRLIEEIARRLDIVSESGRGVLEQIMLEAPRNASDEELYVFIYERYKALTTACANNSAVIGVDAYNTHRELQIGSRVESNYTPKISGEEISKLVYDVAKQTREVGDISVASTMLGHYLDSAIMHSYADAIINTGLADNVKPRFARVPTGANPCKFCLMLASRGYVYLTAETAGAFNKYHNFCRCQITPNFDKRGNPVEVDGYDPDELYERYKAGEFGEVKQKKRTLNYKTVAQPKIENPVKVNVEDTKLPDKFYGGKWNQKEDMKTFLETLFNKDDFVGTCSQFYKKDGRVVPSKGLFQRKLGHILGVLDRTGNVSSAIGRYDTRYGAYVRINPLDGKGITDQNVTAFKYALLECDVGSVEHQYGFIKALNIPTKAIVTSGNKSVHAVVIIDGKDADDYKKRVSRLYAECRASGFEVDGTVKNPSRYMRIPGVKRGAGRQVLVSTNEGAKSFEEWLKWCDKNR